MIGGFEPLWLTCVLLGLWGLLAGSQLWVDAPAWRTGGALGWDLMRLRRSRLYRAGGLARLLEVLPVKVLAALLLAASLGLMVTPSGPWTFALLTLYGAVIVLLTLRNAADGATKIALVCVYGAMLQTAGLLSGQVLFSIAGTAWIAGQLTIAYFTSGISKLARSTWRNGSAPSAALSSHIWGHRLTARAMMLPGAALALAWLLMLAEALFPIALLAPQPVLLAALAAMFAFHFATAVFMGLNTYPLAFLAAYPSVLALGQYLRSLT